MTEVCGAGITGWVRSKFVDCVNRPLTPKELLSEMNGRSDGAKVLKKVENGDRRLRLNSWDDANSLEEDFASQGGSTGAAEAKWLVQQGLMALPGLMTEKEKTELRTNPGVYGQTTAKGIQRLIDLSGLSGVNMDSARCLNYSAPKPNVSGNECNYLVCAIVMRALEAASKGQDWKKAITGMFDSKENILAYQRQANLTGHMTLDPKNWYH